MAVFLVDRSEAVRVRLIGRLRDADLAIAGEASTLAEALAALPTLRPSAIVADVLLPDGRGPVIVSALRARAPGAVIVVVTNATHYRERCLAHGADHFLDKSSQFDEIGVVLRR